MVMTKFWFPQTRKINIHNLYQTNFSKKLNNLNTQSGMACAQKAMSDSDYFKKILKEIK